MDIYWKNLTLKIEYQSCSHLLKVFEALFKFGTTFENGMYSLICNILGCNYKLQNPKVTFDEIVALFLLSSKPEYDKLIAIGFTSFVRQTITRTLQCTYYKEQNIKYNHFFFLFYIKDST